MPVVYFPVVYSLSLKTWIVLILLEKYSMRSMPKKLYNNESTAITSAEIKPRKNLHLFTLQQTVHQYKWIQSNFDFNEVN